MPRTRCLVTPLTLTVDAAAGHCRPDRNARDFGVRIATSHLTRIAPGKAHSPHGYRQFVAGACRS
jgi:hypothetical protein